MRYELSRAIYFNFKKVDIMGVISHGAISELYGDDSDYHPKFSNVFWETLPWKYGSSMTWTEIRSDTVFEKLEKNSERKALKTVEKRFFVLVLGSSPEQHPHNVTDSFHVLQVTESS